MKIVPFEVGHVATLEITSESVSLDDRQALMEEAVMGPAWTAVTDEGKVIGSAGLRPIAGRRGCYFAWATFGPLLHSHRFSIHKHVYRFLHTLNGLEDYGRIEATIDLGNDRAREWAWSLGFRPTERAFSWQGHAMLVVYLPKGVA